MSFLPRWDPEFPNNREAASLLAAGAFIGSVLTVVLIIIFENLP